MPVGRCYHPGNGIASLRRSSTDLAPSTTRGSCTEPGMRKCLIQKTVDWRVGFTVDCLSREQRMIEFEIGQVEGHIEVLPPKGRAGVLLRCDPTSSLPGPDPGHMINSW